jgi:hypothetical protein
MHVSYTSDESNEQGSIGQATTEAGRSDRAAPVPYDGNNP